VNGTLWTVLWVVLIGGGWAGNHIRGALRTRHNRQMERLEAQARRQRELEAANRQPEPVCGCTHHLAKHDKQGKCHELVETPVAWDEAKKPVRYESQTCNCQQYIGPQPLTTLYAQDLTDLDGTPAAAEDH
jgi:hypothetical protein